MGDKMRGCEKRVIYLKNTGSDLFDEAYFVVSQVGEIASPESCDMVSEANRIIEECIEDKNNIRREEKARRISGFILPFFLGALFTTLIIGAVILISLSV